MTGQHQEDKIPEQYGQLMMHRCCAGASRARLWHPCNGGQPGPHRPLGAAVPRWHIPPYGSLLSRAGQQPISPGPRGASHMWEVLHQPGACVGPMLTGPLRAACAGKCGFQHHPQILFDATASVSVSMSTCLRKRLTLQRCAGAAAEAGE